MGQLVSSSVTLRPTMYVKNNSPHTITCNLRRIRFQLDPIGTPNSYGVVPWPVATTQGFERLWEQGSVTVALDEDFEIIIDELPRNNGDGGLFIWIQEDPVTVIDIEHLLNREGPVLAAIYSLDYSIQWDGVGVQPMTKDKVRLSFEDPTSFVALIR